MQSKSKYLFDTDSKFANSSTSLALGLPLDEEEDDDFSGEDFLYESSEEDLDESNYNMPHNMSSNLLNLFDMAPRNPASINNWIPPQNHGLTNSKPIIRTDGNISPYVSTKETTGFESAGGFYEGRSPIAPKALSAPSSFYQPKKLVPSMVTSQSAISFDNFNRVDSATFNVNGGTSEKQQLFQRAESSSVYSGAHHDLALTATN